MGNLLCWCVYCRALAQFPHTAPYLWRSRESIQTLGESVAEKAAEGCQTASWHQEGSECSLGKSTACFSFHMGLILLAMNKKFLTQLVRSPPQHIFICKMFHSHFPTCQLLCKVWSPILQTNIGEAQGQCITLCRDLFWTSMLRLSTLSSGLFYVAVQDGWVHVLTYGGPHGSFPFTGRLGSRSNRDALGLLMWQRFHLSHQWGASAFEGSSTRVSMEEKAVYQKMDPRYVSNSTCQGRKALDYWMLRYGACDASCSGADWRHFHAWQDSKTKCSHNLHSLAWSSICWRVNLCKSLWNEWEL